MDNVKKPVVNTPPVYVRKSWKEGDFWHVKMYGIAKKNLVQDQFYADTDFKIKHGLTLLYWDNGKMFDSVIYEQNKANGHRKMWDKNGNLTALLHYTNNLLSDTSIYFHENGAVASIVLCDKNGTGIE